MSDTEILPCPFCGSDAEILASITASTIDPNRRFKAQCTNRMKGCPVNARSHYGPTPEEVAAQWNTRARVAPKVKRLDWEDFGRAYTLLEADSPFGKYQITSYKDVFEVSCGQRVIGFYRDVEESQAAAQSDFEQCAISALEI